jgi:hypothetical protein
MSNFKPQVRIITEETKRDYYNGQSKSAFKTVQYPTYRELRKNLRKHLEENLEPTVGVYRSRRGEWGEWFEHWCISGGKVRLIKEGWM